MWKLIAVHYKKTKIYSNKPKIRGRGDLSSCPIPPPTVMTMKPLWHTLDMMFLSKPTLCSKYTTPDKGHCVESQPAKQLWDNPEPRLIAIRVPQPNQIIITTVSFLSFADNESRTISLPS